MYTCWFGGWLISYRCKSHFQQKENGSLIILKIFKEVKPPFFCAKQFMKTQNFKNHPRYFPFHHFLITPLSLFFIVWTINRANFETTESTNESIYALIGALILFLLPLLARIYALKNQNRIILMEMRMRYFHLTGKSFEEKEINLKSNQIIALRFASDNELLSLIDDTIAKKLSSKEIKISINEWRGDYSRV